MSSGTRFDYTLEDRSVLLGQISDVTKFANEQLRPAARISLALQAAIMDDDIIVVPKVTQTPTGKIFHVTSDVKIRTAADAIAATGCKVKWGLAETPEKIPMVIHPVDCRVRAVPLGQVRTTEEIYSFYPKIMTPAEFLAFGARFPKEQEEARHFTVWLDGTGRFWYAVLFIRGDERNVLVRGCRPGGRFYVRSRVLVRE